MSTFWLILAMVAIVWLFVLIHSFIRKPLLAQADVLVNPKVNLGKVVGVHSIQGQRTHMEDSYYADYSKAFFAVYDGHGGSRASQYASKHLHELILQSLSQNYSNNATNSIITNNTSSNSLNSTLTTQRFSNSINSTNHSSLSSSLLPNNGINSNSSSPSSSSPPSPSSPHAALIYGFLELDKQWLDLATINGWDDGSTAITAVILHNTLYVANVGDSRAVLCHNGQAVEMSNDHKPSRLDEKERIEALGGRIIHYGTWRVEGVLAVTRAIGDRRLKKYITATPEIRQRLLTDADDYLILASDGVWDVMSSQQACDVVLGCSDVRQAAMLLTTTAYQKNSQDNITTMVIDLRSYR